MPPLLLASITSAVAISTPPDLAVSDPASTLAPPEQSSKQPDDMIQPNLQPHTVSLPELLEIGPGIGQGQLQTPQTLVGLTPLSSESESTSIEFKQHVVRSGETIWEIAQEYNLSSQAILAANPGVAPKKLQVNQTLTLPLPKSPEINLTPEVNLNPSKFKQHVVRSGETIWEIAREYNLSSQAILAANPGVAPKRLRIDQVLTIPISQSAEAAPTSIDTPSEERINPTVKPPVAAPAAAMAPTPTAPLTESLESSFNRLDWIAEYGRALGISTVLGIAAVLALWYWRRAPSGLYLLPNLRDKELPPNNAASIYGGVANPVRIAPEPPVRFQTESVSAARVSEAANWSTFVQTVLDQPPSTLPHRLLSGGVVFCLAFGAWAWMGQIEEIGRAQGQLVPKGDVYKVQFVDPGKVIDIAVEEGQRVEAGQVLVELDTQTAASEVELRQQNLTALQTQLSQKHNLIAKTRLEAGSRAAIAKADHQAQEVAIAQAETRAHTNQILLTQIEVEVADHQARLERLKPLLERGAISREEIFVAEQALRERQRAITQSRGERRQALAEAERLQAGLAQKRAEGQRAQLDAQQQIQQLEAEATQLSAKIDETRNLLNIAKLELKRRYLYAPVNGVILSLEVSNIGEVIKPGQIIAELAPVDAPLVLSAKLPNQEAGFVEVGMSVQVKFDAYPYQDYGVVSGRVTAISPDAEMDEYLGEVYNLEINLDRDHVATRDQLIRFKAGQTASADIVIRQRRIADVLLDPIRQLQQDGISL